MVGWAADLFENEVGEALMERLPVRIGCHNGKDVSWLVGEVVLGSSRVAVALQGGNSSVCLAGPVSIPLC